MGIVALSTAAQFGLIAQQPQGSKSPEEIQAEIDQAQRDFEAAKAMFIPWYTGPLITGSANNVPKGRVNIQPYLFLNNQYAVYTDNRGTTDVPEVFTVQPLFIYQYGYTDFIDSTLNLSGFFRWRDRQYAQGFGDIAYSLGFQLMKQTPYRPSIRFTVGETFPTGKFRNLNPDKGGIQGTGGGVFSSQLGLFINKIFWKLREHPVSVRLAGIYSIPNHEAHVTGFNAYGGGFGTDGHVKVGHNIQADLGLELSLTQKWVFATDIAYEFSFKSTFSGIPGSSSNGAPASNGGPSNDQLSIAPAIEYNPNPLGGFIGGVWFSVTGRNSSVFVAGVLSYTQLF